MYVYVYCMSMYTVSTRTLKYSILYTSIFILNYLNTIQYNLEYIIYKIIKQIYFIEMKC